MNSARSALIIIMAIGLLLRLAVFIGAGANASFPAFEYEGIAGNIIKGAGFQTNYLNTAYYSCTTPLYPLICAGIYALFGHNYGFVILLQIIISVLTCLIIFDLARRVFDPGIGLLSAVLFALHPGIILYSAAKLHTFTFDALFLCLTLLLFMRLKEPLLLKRSLLAGVIAGLCILFRSTVIAFVPVGCLWVLFIFRKNMKKAWISNLLILAGILVVLFPWVMRNFIVHKEFILTTSADAEVFWRGNNSNASGTSYTAAGNTVLGEDRDFFNKVISLPELEQRRLFREEAVKFIKENPVEFARLFFRKFYYFWWFSPASGLFYPRIFLVIYRYLYILFISFFILGLLGVLKHKIKTDYGNLMLLFLFLLSISVFQSFFYVEGRHRLAIEPVFLIISAAGLTYVFDSIRQICSKTKT